MSVQSNIVLNNWWALGDAVCMSALIRDIHRAHPGKYKIAIGGNYKNVFWRNNPHVEVTPDRAGEGSRGQLLRLSYGGGIQAAGRGTKKHFLSWFHHDFQRLTGVSVPVTEPKGDIHLSDDEKQAKIPDTRYWLVVAGGKEDMTAKIWSAKAWQTTVDLLAQRGITCVQAGGAFRRHLHTKLDNVIQMVGRTPWERDFFSLIYNCEGVLCGVTAAMHIAAVFDKPCVVVAGGREEPWWEGYTNESTSLFGPQCTPVKVPHRFLHTLGQIDCGVGNMVKGCWRDKVLPQEPADRNDPHKKGRLCKKPILVEGTGQYIPQCLTLITPEMVVEAVLSYYADGTLPSLDAPMPKHWVWKMEEAEAGPAPIPLPVVAAEANGQPVRAPRLPAVPATPPATPPALSPPTKAVPAVGWEALDHPFLGGKVTVFVLGYGDHYHLIYRCLHSILTTCPADRIDLRVALNQPSSQVEEYVRSLGSRITKVYTDHGERRKYPAMRAMFHDPDCPITTPYLTWFDDDSWAKRPDWLPALARVITANHPHGGRLYGAWMFHDLMMARRKNPHALADRWFKAGKWWRNKPLFLANGKRPAGNGSQIVFASGGFWSLCTQTVREADIPDERLVHNGGDICCAAQVHQVGGKVVDFSAKKDIICWSDGPRRGYSERFPWM